MDVDLLVRRWIAPPPQGRDRPAEQSAGMVAVSTGSHGRASPSWTSWRLLRRCTFH